MSEQGQESLFFPDPFFLIPDLYFLGSITFLIES